MCSLTHTSSSSSLQVSNGDLAEAVAFLTEKNAKVPQQDETTYYQTSQVASDRYISVGSQADTSEYITLTSVVGELEIS